MSSPAAMPLETVELKLEDTKEDDTQNPHGSTDLLDAWRQINGHLTSAVLISKEAVAAKKLQRRFWMEELCANLTEDGKLTYKSVWKRPVPSKKTAIKKTVTKKRKKAEPKPKKMAAKKKKTEKQEQTNEDGKVVVVAPKKLTLKLKKPPTEAPRQEAAAGEEIEQDSQQDTSDEENHSGSEMASATKAAYQSDSMMYNDREGSHESSSYGHVPSWGSGQHDNYMVRHTFVLFCLLAL
jgi:hypothetical protein